MGFRNQYSTPISATSTNTTVLFGFEPAYLLLVNDGPDSVHLDFTGVPATTNDFELKSGETVTVTAEETANGMIGGRLDAICAATETAVTRVLALV